jgi:hypothetical protein
MSLSQISSKSIRNKMLKVIYKLIIIDIQFMQVSEIWRLESIKDQVIEKINCVLKQKIKMWENLSSGETSNLDKL